MKPLLICTVLAALASPSLCPAQTNPYEGTWTASFKTKSGTDRDGTVVIQATGGSWDMNVQSRSNPCTGLKAPITVVTADAEHLVFNIERSKVMTGCSDSQLSLTRGQDASTLVGQLNGSDFSLKRK